MNFQSYSVLQGFQEKLDTEGFNDLPLDANEMQLSKYYELYGDCGSCPDWWSR